MRSWPATLFVFFFAFFALLSSSGTTARAEPHLPSFIVIVNPNNSVTSVERKFLEEAFLKKTTRWSDDRVIRPVDLPASSQARRRFSDEILERSVEAVKLYWQQRIFAGRDLPPPELDTDDDVVRYVLKYEGAVGYVSGNAYLNGSKVVSVH